MPTVSGKSKGELSIPAMHGSYVPPLRVGNNEDPLLMHQTQWVPDPEGPIRSDTCSASTNARKMRSKGTSACNPYVMQTINDAR